MTEEANANQQSPSANQQSPNANEQSANTNQRPVADRARDAVDSIRPYIQADGGDIEFIDCVDGVVSVRLHGACTGCPHAALTLKAGVERHLREQVPEVVEVINVG